MAEPSTPAGEPTGDARPVADPGGATDPESDLLAPPTEEELADTGEPSADQIHAAAAGDTEVIRAPQTRVIHPAETETIHPAETEVIRSTDTGSTRDDGTRAPAETAVVSEPEVARPGGRAVAAPAAVQPPPPPPAQQPVLAPAAASAPPPPRLRGNRLVATAWVLLAAGLFQVLYFGALALIILLLSGVNAVGPGITNIARFPFAWLPVLFFFLFFELTVLLLNRAGRFAYVVASLIVGLLVYVVSVLLISILVGGGIGDTPTLARAFESPEFVLTGLVAREVMLWTGFAIGSRGIRVRRRNAEDRARFDAEVADGRD